MMKGPTKEELHERITTHLRRRHDSEVVHLLWKGYTAALTQWGLLHPDDNEELSGLLKEVGDDELYDLVRGFVDELDK